MSWHGPCLLLSLFNDRAHQALLPSSFLYALPPNRAIPTSSKAITMFNAFITLLVAAVALPLVLAQEQVPIYVPFEWSRVPRTASVIGSSGATTTYALIDGPGTGRVTPGPATLVQGPDGASMFYVNSAAAATPTLSGVCNLVSPVAVCTLNVFETGAPLPGGASTTSSGRSTTNTAGSGSGGTSAASTTTSSTGTILMMTTVALGFCVSLAFLR